MSLYGIVRYKRRYNSLFNVINVVMIRSTRIFSHLRYLRYYTSILSRFLTIMTRRCVLERYLTLYTLQLYKFLVEPLQKLDITVVNIFAEPPQALLNFRSPDTF